MNSSGRRSWFGILSLLLLLAACTDPIVNIEEPAEVETCEWLIPVGIELVNDYVYTLIETDLAATQGDVAALTPELVALNARGQELDARAQELECDLAQLNATIADATSGIESDNPAVVALLESLRGGLAVSLDPAFGEWALRSGAVAEVAIETVPEHPIVLMVDAVAASGFGGCNGFYYPIVLEEGTWSWDQEAASVTDNLCTDAEMQEVKTVEAAFLAALENVDTYSVQDDMLVLTGPGVELRFDRAESAGNGS